MTRVENLQDDTFDRLNALLQDQVPFAASKVGREIVPVVIVGTFIVVLVGAEGVQLTRRFMSHMRAKPRPAPLAAFLSNLKLVPRIAAVVGAPMLLLAGTVFVTYVIYYNRADAQRVGRLETAAREFERAGDFKSAWSVRRRVASLTESNDARYWVERNKFLADFAQPTLLNDASDFSRRLGVLQSRYSVEFSKDGELQAAQIYTDAQYAQFDPKFALAALTARIAAYEKQFFAGGAKFPELGKLVLVTKYRAAINDWGKPLQGRVQNGLLVLDDLVAKYPTYAPGRATRANVLSIQGFSNGYYVSPLLDEKTLATAEQRAKDDMAIVESENPRLKQILTIQLAALPSDPNKPTEDVVGQLAAAMKVAADKRKDDANFKAASEGVNAFAERLVRDAVAVYGHEAMARAEVERVVARAMFRDVSLRLLDGLRAEAKRAQLSEPDLGKKYAAYMAVVSQAKTSDQPLIAESWLEEAQKLCEGTPDGFKDKLDAVKKELDSIRNSVLTNTYPTLL